MRARWAQIFRKPMALSRKPMALSRTPTARAMGIRNYNQGHDFSH